MLVNIKIMFFFVLSDMKIDSLYIDIRMSRTRPTKNHSKSIFLVFSDN